MKLLITGTGGYLGSIATRSFLREGHQIVGVDSLSRGYREPQEILQKEYGKQWFRFYKADIKKGVLDVLEKEPGIDAAIHFAAYCNVGESEKSPGMYFENNTAGTIQLLEDLMQNNIKKIVFSSTCATYGTPKYSPIDENHPAGQCTSAYGESKYLAERIIRWYGSLNKMDYVILRYFNICGASDDARFGDSKNPSFHLMQNAVRAALGLCRFKLNFTEVDTPDRSPIRDYINVEDLALAHIRAIELINSGTKNQIINLGTGSGNSVFDLIAKVERQMGVTFEKSTEERRNGDAARAIADNSKALELLNWTPKRSLEDSIESSIRWYKNRPTGWDR